MSDERKKVEVADPPKTIDIDLEEPAEANIVPSKADSATKQNRIRLVEFGKLPTQVLVEAGQTVGDLVQKGLLSPNQDYYVNGILVDEDFVLNEGDAVVGAPRIAGGLV